MSCQYLKKSMNNYGLIHFKWYYIRHDMKVLKKGIIIAGAIMRSLIGIGATALLVLGLKKKKTKKK